MSQPGPGHTWCHAITAAHACATQASVRHGQVLCSDMQVIILGSSHAEGCVLRAPAMLQHILAVEHLVLLELQTRLGLKACSPR